MFGSLHVDDDGWHVLDANQLKKLFPNAIFEHRYKDVPEEGRRIIFPIKLRWRVQRCGAFSRELVDVYFQKDHANLDESFELGLPR